MKSVFKRDPKINSYLEIIPEKFALAVSKDDPTIYSQDVNLLSKKVGEKMKKIKS
ncbi:MAG: hypothetical protein GWN31_07960 [Candidatus Thorarchaeota archaeon]|nr:hypothetical protein [Candidatus Thorarchaeota archaeon]NIW13851.1 hypothetical protein [Candidatus Thorarchaeota archaeon]NIW51962.1 hypothetical protein [Candidatus Korarchaeota archaeon]